jgi:hypothetical protein
MRVSIAMATWNGWRHLPDQLASLAAQTRPPDELVISDDASEDGTVEIAERFGRVARFEVRVLRHRTRVGSSENFFRAMRECTGDVIAPCDQDDVWHPQKLARIAPLFTERPERPAVTMAAHGGIVVDAELRRLRQLRYPIRRRRTVAPGSRAPLGDFRGGCTLMFPSLFVARANFAARPSRLPAEGGGPISHDDWVNLVCAALGRTELLPDRLIKYRRHDATASTSYNPLASAPPRPRTRPDPATLFCDIAVAAEARAAYLGSLAPLAAELGPAAEAGLRRAIAAHRGYAEAMRGRARRYREPDPRRRVALVAQAAAGGEYGPRSRGGLGPRAVARDLTTGLFARRLDGEH